MKRSFMFLMVFSLILSATGMALGEEEKIASDSSLMQETLPSPEAQWILGEVTSIDIPANKIKVKHFDYENDIEKEVTLDINDQTKYNEKTGSLSQLKIGDSVTVDCVVEPSGANIAKNISVEQPEETPVPAQTTTTPNLDPGTVKTQSN